MTQAPNHLAGTGMLSEAEKTNYGSKIFDTQQKKLLEKMYAKIFDLSGVNKGKAPELTEEGQMLLQRANIQASDLLPKTLEDFLKQE